LAEAVVDQGSLRVGFIPLNGPLCNAQRMAPSRLLVSIDMNGPDQTLENVFDATPQLFKTGLSPRLQRNATSETF
tara:strand:- start:37 stop:261 length:225 start_codon:yes stop_codon:yes gene_type:complete